MEELNKLIHFIKDWNKRNPQLGYDINYVDFNDEYKLAFITVYPTNDTYFSEDEIEVFNRMRNKHRETGIIYYPIMNSVAFQTSFWIKK